MANFSSAQLRSLIHGAYTLIEWHKPRGVVRTPQVAGRFMLIDGAVATIWRDESEAAVQATLAAFGRYTLTGDEFSYGYDESTAIAKTSAGVTVSREPLWKGMRRFRVVRETDAVRLTASGGQEFLFAPEGLKYSEGGKLLRVWRRVEPN